LFFVEDTSLRIEALSKGENDVPGLAVKEWFAQTTFAELDNALKRPSRCRSAVVKSDIGLHVPGLQRPVFFHGETLGRVADTPPHFPPNPQYPWLTPDTFNGWFIPAGATNRLGEMSLEESWSYDFRIRALESLIQRLEEYAAALNLPIHAYSKPSKVLPVQERWLFRMSQPVLIVVGKTCAGKSTFGERARASGLHWIEASSVLRTLTSDYEEGPKGGLELAKLILQSKGADVVARKTLQLYADKFADGVVITGFRTIEELETIKAQFPDAQVLVIEATERARYQRYLARGRLEPAHSRRDFRISDENQWSFGLLRVAEDFADLRIINEGSLPDFLQQIGAVLGQEGKIRVSGISRRVRPRHGLRENQLYRCLVALHDAGRALSCNEIQKETGRTGAAVRFNNVNKVLKKVPELANRYALSGSRLRYDITNAGRAYVRYMQARDGS